MSDHLVSEALYLSDPDGNGIEIYADRPRQSWRTRNGQLELATVPLNVNDLLSELDDHDNPWTGLPPGPVSAMSTCMSPISSRLRHSIAMCWVSTWFRATGRAHHSCLPAAIIITLA